MSIKNTIIYSAKEYVLADNINPNVFCITGKTISLPLDSGGTLDIPNTMSGLHKIKSVSIKSCDKAINTINDYFLSNCFHLSNVDLKGLKNVVSIGKFFIHSSFKLTSIDLNPLSSVETI